MESSPIASFVSVKNVSGLFHNLDSNIDYNMYRDRGNSKVHIYVIVAKELRCQKSKLIQRYFAIKKVLTFLRNHFYQSSATVVVVFYFDPYLFNFHL